MHVSPDELLEALRSQGLRITSARRAVCAVIAARHGQHLTAASILAAVEEDPAAGADQSTVYRTLDALEEAGVLVHSHLGQGPVVYHLPSEAQHQHVVCHRCGATAAIPAGDLDDWVAKLRASTGYEVDPTHFAVTGICPECAAETDRAG